jgi:hypothetical protein
LEVVSPAGMIRNEPCPASETIFIKEKFPFSESLCMNAMFLNLGFSYDHNGLVFQ